MTSPEQRPDIGFIPTPDDAIAAMLRLASLSPHDHVYDLGCGDGRLLIRATLEYGVTGVGIDVDRALLTTARATARETGVNQQVTFIEGNLFEADVSDATVVFIYLLPHLNLRLRQQLLQQLHPGSRIISHQFDMGNWVPELILKLEPSEEDSVLYLWRVSDPVPDNLLVTE